MNVINSSLRKQFTLTLSRGGDDTAPERMVGVPGSRARGFSFEKQGGASAIAYQDVGAFLSSGTCRRSSPGDELFLGLGRGGVRHEPHGHGRRAIEYERRRY